MHAQIRVQNINSKEAVKRLQIHNNREYAEYNFTPPKNILGDDVASWGYRTHTSVQDNYDQEQKIDYNKMIDQRFEEVGVTPRKGAVIALEYVVGFSKEVMINLSNKGNYSLVAALDKQIEFLQKKHGEQNIISRSYHFDESNPHAHVLVVPLVQKKTKWQDRKEEQNGIVENAHLRLCAKDFTGGRAKLSKMQDDFFDHCNDWTRKRLGLNLTKHKKAEIGVLKYEKKTSPELGQFRDELRAIEIEIENTRIKLIKEHEEGLRTLEQTTRLLEEANKLAISTIKKAEEKRQEIKETFNTPEEVISKIDLKNIKHHQKSKIESNKPLIPQEVPKVIKKNRGM